MNRNLVVSLWVYLLVVLGSLCLLYVAGDRWWPATILLFSPRWLLALPLLVLAPLAIRRRSFLLLVPLLGAVLVLFGPLMGLQLNWPEKTLSHGQVLRVLTYNVHEGRFNAKQFSQFLQESMVDLVALQECPEDVLFSMPHGWHGIQQRGFAVFSRHPFRLVKVMQVQQVTEKWPGTHLMHVEVHTPAGPVALCSIHFPSPRFGLQAVLDKYTLLRPSRKKVLERQTKARWLAATEVQKYLSGIALPLLVVGDFNTPPDSPLFREVWDGYYNAFSETGFGYGWTQRVSVRGLPFGARIDHVLTRNGLKPLLCEVGPDMGSDHLPLIADVARESN